ncbi:MAG: HEAT repeat domain-containing protein [Methylococcales bacterium]
MRLLNFNTVALFTALVAAFLSGYFVRDLKPGQQSSLATAGEVNAVSVADNPLKPQKPETAKQNKIVQLVQTSQTNTYKNTVPVFVSQSAPAAEQQVVDPVQQQSAEQLLGTIESLSGQQKTPEEVRDSKEFQQLLSLMATDPITRKGLLERFLKVTGTPFGDVLSLALAMSGGGQEIPEIKTAAVQLLQSGNTQQRLNALQLLGQANTLEPGARAMVLDILRHDANTNPQLAKAAMATFSQKGVVSQGEYQEVMGTIVPLLHSEDPQVRQSSLQVLSQWAGRDQAALQTFTEASHDTDPGVRSLAITTLGQGGFAYNSVRDTLLSVLQNPDEAPVVKAATQQALEGFPLDEQALAIYQAHISNPLNQQTQVGFN